MARPYCSDCGETFGSRYRLNLHEELNDCNEGNDSHKGSDSFPSESGTQNSHSRDTQNAIGSACEFNDEGGYGFVITADVTSKSGNVEYTEDVFFI